MKKKTIQTFRIKDMLDFRTLKSKEQIEKEEREEKSLTTKFIAKQGTKTRKK